MSYETVPQLWIPGQDNDLSEEYPAATQEELTKKWLDYNPDAHAIDAPGVYGVMAIPQKTPEVYVSLDICEVMRDTHLAVRSLISVNEERYKGNIHAYGIGTCLENAADHQAAIRVLMNAGHVKPVESIGEISDIIEEASDVGAYVFANTSTLSGCEIATVDFLKEYVPKGLQGVAFPRNHDGLHPLTKGVVLKNIVDRFSDPKNHTLAIHLDDVPHHNISARTEMAKRPNSETTTIMPRYETHLAPDHESNLTETPLIAFRAMREVLRDYFENK